MLYPVHLPLTNVSGLSHHHNMHSLTVLPAGPSHAHTNEHEWPLKTIELVEVTPPPPRSAASYYSSSYASTSSEESSESEQEEEMAVVPQQEDEEVLSYCSSDEDEELAQHGLGPRAPTGGNYRRVLAWRESFSASTAVPMAPSSPVVRSASAPSLSSLVSNPFPPFVPPSQRL